ncbi:reverse transcriptase domain-containing protein [Bacillus norwichensis]|uniref:RNA-directed DNA polymerase n=1 Tax=Bacillus norwichensis TaxID=2762217 RepID=A0ABR8VN04_9BACI|nr:reverse transcriptase domain-containing protein [Bacillus norwichensis]MBD8006152.1 RNA-directed DNA polymerase [Bacillus norwichensis]
MTNPHTYSLYLLQLDIKDFFPSISKERVFYIFKNTGYNNVISNVLANLCTLNGSLPQGGVTSPYLSNLVCYSLDRRLQGLCGKRDIIYTRYADDLTFSCDNKEILKNLFNVIKEILEDEGFELNKSKIRFLSPISHKNITGITIDSRRQLKVNKTLKKKVRAMIHKSIVSGDYKESSKILGYVSYIDSIEKGFKEKVLDYINSLIKKDYKYFDGTVKAYNRNKLYKELNTMEKQDFHSDLDKYYKNDQMLRFNIERDTFIFYEYIEMLESRRQYLSKYNLRDEKVDNELLEYRQSAVSIDVDEDPTGFF